VDAPTALVEFARRHGVKILSDGDWDGILASALLVKWLRKQGFKCGVSEVEFPKPRKLYSMKIKDYILVELPPSRGYIVEDEALLFDHHGVTGLFLVRRGEQIEKLIKTREFPSAARLVSFLLDIKLAKGYEKLLKAVDLIDTGESRKDSFAWMIHKAYLINTDSSEFRRIVLAMLIEDKIKDLIEYLREESKAYDKALEKINILESRVRSISNRIAFFTTILVSETRELFTASLCLDWKKNMT